jgi:hypothetical protein
VSTLSENSNGLTVTLKAGVGFEAPWIVIHAADATDALNQINTGDFATLAERTVAAAEFFRAAHNVKGGLASREPAPAAPQQSWSEQPAQQAPAPQGGGAHQCVHGPRVRKELKVGTPEEYVGYFCPLPKGANTCKAEWAKKGQ